MTARGRRFTGHTHTRTAVVKERRVPTSIHHRPTSGTSIPVMPKGVGKKNKGNRRNGKKKKAPPAPRLATAAQYRCGGPIFGAGSDQQQQDDGAGDDSAQPQWKFNKTRQTFLLRFWPNRMKVTSATFKLLLSYARSLPAGPMERTLAQAREVAAKAETDEAALAEKQATKAARAASAQDSTTTGRDEDDDDGDDDDDANGDETVEELEEQRAVLKIQRARAVKLLQVLGSDVVEQANAM